MKERKKERERTIATELQIVVSSCRCVASEREKSDGK